ncbi:MAG: cell division protein FtsA [Candidatus Goldbacteria bacterium]|nr:cell division protein FtsA [Candidatus Goldiibacteriota bacterium]
MIQTQPVLENIIAAVDIGTTKICTIIAEVMDKEINVIGVGWQENTGVVKGAIANINETTIAIKKSIEKAEEMAKVKVHSVIASISGKHISGIKGHGETTLSHTKLKEITEDDKNNAIRAATSFFMPADKEILHIIPTQYIVDSQDEIEDPVGMTGMKLEVDAYIITGSITSIDNVRKVIEHAGYNVVDIIVQGVASASAVLFNDEKDIGVLVLDIGGGTTDMVVYYKNAIRFAKVIPVGGQLITNDLVSALQTSKSVAEDLKKRYGIFTGEADEKDETITFPDMGSSKTIEIQLSKISPYIKLRVQELIKFVKAELEKDGIDRSLYSGGVVLTGGTSLLKGIDKIIKEEMDLRVRIGVPLKEKIIGLYDIVSSPEYATAVGLIDYYVNFQIKSQKTKISKGIFEEIWDFIKKFFVDNI